MSLSTSALVLLLAAVNSVMGQGDPAALQYGTRPNPTQSWSQWTPKPTYRLEDLPAQYMGANRIPGGGEPQSGYNQCVNGTWNQKSLCQTAFINSVEDWCIWGPPEGGDIGSTERVAVAYCTTNRHGTRLIPDGTITGAHFLQTPNYVQISGVGDFTTIGIPQGDAGGEMDNAAIGGVVFTTAIPGTNGVPTQARYWTNFMSYNQYCLRACWGPNAAAHCQHIYDVLGCRWNMPSLTGYDAGVFESCEGDNAPFQGVYGGSTFQQGQPVTPDPHPPAPSSNCVTRSSLRHGLYAISSSTSSSSSTMATTRPTGSTTGTSPTGTAAPPRTSTTSQGNTGGTSGALSSLATPSMLSNVVLAIVVAGALCALV